MRTKFKNVIKLLLEATGKMFSSEVQIKLGVSYTGEEDETQFFMEWEDEGVYQTSLADSVEQALIKMNNILDMPLEKRERFKVG
jgi:hypothetical protein